MAGWVSDRLRDSLTIDRNSDRFRYAGSQQSSELWIDFHRLHSVMDRLVGVFEEQLR